MKTENISDCQQLILDIYGIPDDRLYEVEDLLYYGQKFSLKYFRMLKIKNIDIASENLIISLAWFLALMNRFHIDLEKVSWKRYSFKCPFCLEIPCICLKKEDIKAQKTGRPSSRKPKDISKWQEMLGKIYQNGSADKWRIHPMF